MLRFAAFLVVVLAVAEAHVYTRCELAQTLVGTYGWPQADMGDWVCLCEHESSLNTAAVGAVNSDGTQDFGLFQINSYWWCSGGPNSKYNSCGVPCSVLTNDNIDDDTTCAWMIYQQQGFDAWYGWINNCQGDVSSYVAGCF
ncbi:hypothetical protein CHUAL_007813 [Chamberlinius hualienensis]